MLLQVVVRSPAVGDLHPGRVSLPRRPRGGALQAAEGGTPHGKTFCVHPGAVSTRTHREQKRQNESDSTCNPDPCLQVPDDEGLLERRPVPQAHLPAAGGGLGPKPFSNGQPGNTSLIKTPPPFLPVLHKVNITCS